MAQSKWHQMTDEQKAQHRAREKVARSCRKQSMDEEGRLALSEQRKEARRRRQSRPTAREVAREYKRNGKGYFYSWAQAIKQRAHEKGVPYDLDADFLQELLPKKCPVLGVELRRKTTRADNAAFSPTVDRIFPDRGYVRDNVIIVSRRANNIKSDAAPEEIMRVAQFYQKLCDGLK
jgi:hypothetical protein